jgi:hypothetical protein
MKFCILLYALLFFFGTQRSTIEEKEFSLFKRAAITGFISSAAFVTQKLLTSKKFSSPLKFVSAGLPATYILSHIGYTYAPAEYLNTIFKLTHKLYLDKVFFLSSPSQILAKKIKKINLETTNHELLNETLFYLSRKEQIETILKINDIEKINKIASLRTDLSIKLIEENDNKNKKLETFLSKLNIDTFNTIAKSQSKKFAYPTHIKKMFELQLFKKSNCKINFLIKANRYKPINLDLFFSDYINDVTTNISLLVKEFRVINIVYSLSEANRLHEIKGLLENPDISPSKKEAIITNINSFLKNTLITDENKTKLKKILEETDEIKFWKTLDRTSNKKFHMFQTITTHFIHENTIENIFKDEIKNLDDKEYNPAKISGDFTFFDEELQKREFLGFLCLLYPETANKILKNQESQKNSINLLQFYYLITNIYINNDNLKSKITPYVNKIRLLKNIATIFNEIEFKEIDPKNEIKNFITLLQKDISEILKNELLKNQIEKSNLYQKFIVNQIMTKKKKITSIKELTEITSLINLNEEQEAILIVQHNIDYTTLQDNKKTRIQNIIESNKYKKELINKFTLYENVAKKILLERTFLNNERLEHLVTQYKKKTNFSAYEIEAIAIFSVLNINSEKTKSYQKKFKQLKQTKLLEQEIEKIQIKFSKIIDDLKSQNNLLLNKRIFIESVNSLENFNKILKDLTEKDLAKTLLNQDLKEKQAINILSELILSDRNKAQNVVKLMQKTNNNRFQKLYEKLDQKSKINLTKENE